MPTKRYQLWEDYYEGWRITAEYDTWDEVIQAVHASNYYGFLPLVTERIPLHIVDGRNPNRPMSSVDLLTK